MPLDWLKICGQGSHTFGFHSGDRVDLSALEGGVEFLPIRQLSLVLGWRRWRYEADRDDLITGTSLRVSDLDLEVTGPMVLLQVTF